MDTKIYLENPRREKQQVEQEIVDDSTMKESAKVHPTMPTFLHTLAQQQLNLKHSFTPFIYFREKIKSLSFTQTLYSRETGELKLGSLVSSCCCYSSHS